MSIKGFIEQRLSLKHKNIVRLFLSKIKLLFLKKQIGKNSYVDSTVTVFGWAHVAIGKNTLIGEQSWLNVNVREAGFNHIQIGDSCYIGRRNLLSSSRKLILGDFVMTSNECKFLGSNHIFSNPMLPYIETGTTNDDFQKIGANTWIGAGAIVLGAVTIGHGSIIGAGSIVTKNIAPFSIAVGNPCKVIKRYDFRKEKWVKVGDFNISMEELMPLEDEYVRHLKLNSKSLDMPKMAATSKYGDLY
jgi:acetyltransferase-like isoleucine patch superfamily enzyme